MLNTADVLRVILERGYIQDIGQIQDDTKVVLKRLVHQKRLDKSRQLWCGMREKTTYSMPGMRF